jgi:cytidylate kinase
LRNGILALVGMPAAGKSTVSQMLQEKFGYNWVRTRDVVKLFARDDRIHSLQATGTNLSAGPGAEAFCLELFRRINSDHPSVIDAIRPIDHWQRLKNEYGRRVTLVSVVAPRSLRQQRIRDAREETIESRDSHKVEADIPSLIEQSSYTIVNQDGLDFRIQQLVDFANFIADRSTLS